MSLTSNDIPPAMSPVNLLPGVPLIESPLFEQVLETWELTDTERNVATQLHERGYAVIDFPDPAFEARSDRIRANLAPRFPVDFDDPEASKIAGDMRVQDAWRFDPDVKTIATNPDVVSLLTKLYGRRAFPFQTLNFPVGTQQTAHSDAVHFSSQPERFMCGVWVALEDIHVDAGPLIYYPGSHKWPIVSNAMIGRRGWKSSSYSAQAPFERIWASMAEAHRIRADTFIARKGQALIWTANLLHGGSKQTDARRTRWSQVTHYYFSDCIYYTPAFSDEPLGKFDLRDIVNIETGEKEPNTILGEQAVAFPVLSARHTKRSRLAKWIGLRGRGEETLPDGFDVERYYSLNPDVAAAGDDAIVHYLKHGKSEGRCFR
jgi:hypothetical protein